MAGTRPPSPDPIDDRFRRHSRLIGSGVTLAVALYVTIYASWTWERPHRAALVAVVLGGAVASLALLAIPIDVVTTRLRRSVLALAWTALALTVVTVLVALDGGTTGSALATLYFVPLLFATLAFPPGLMAVCSVGAVATYVVASIVDGADGAATFAFASALTTSSGVCAALSWAQHRQRDALARLSRADPLTGCLNRRGLEERLHAELARAQRSGRPVSLVVLDLDRFKAVNDREGHAAGDARLRWTVECLAAGIRPSDALGRLGGDEFAVVLPETPAARAEQVAARLSQALGERSPASFGVATSPDDGREAERLMVCADQRLYAAKARR
ncbi:MAG: GGDEF domain-containing protein [Solirubrobacteraceae bacterium]|nr:GGDEF domain-containing protein [Solirubrobacteraceae bacterium]